MKRCPKHAALRKHKTIKPHIYLCACFYAILLGGRFGSMCQLSIYGLSAPNQISMSAKMGGGAVCVCVCVCVCVFVSFTSISTGDILFQCAVLAGFCSQQLSPTVNPWGVFAAGSFWWDTSLSFLRPNKVNCEQVSTSKHHNSDIQ
jgi:hypothetical protein